MVDVKIRPGGARRSGGVFKAKSALPGPGSHDIPSFPEISPVIPTASAFSMASGRKEPLQRKCRAGPGSYHPRYELTRETGLSVGFGCSKRILSDVGKEERSSSTPAPALSQGDNQKFKRAPGYGFGSEEKFFRAPGLWSDLPGRGSKMPGPGEHNPSDHSSSRTPRAPAFSAGAPRDQLPVVRRKRNDGPGPGEYRPENSGHMTSQVKAAPKFGFGTSERLMGTAEAGRRKFEKSPGPGAYTTMNATRTGHSTLGNSSASPRWTMAGRQELDLLSGT